MVEESLIVRCGSNTAWANGAATPASTCINTIKAEDNKNQERQLVNRQLSETGKNNKMETMMS